MRLADPSLLRKVVERHSLPFATTTMAKGLIDEDHRLSLGCIERACRQMQRKLLRSADLIVGLGYDTIEVEYEAWIGDVPLFQIDIEPPDVAPSVNLVHHVGGELDAVAGAARGAAARHQHAGRRRRSPIIAAHSSRRCGPPPIPSARMPRSTRCAARCRATACCRSTSARIPIRSPASGRRMRPRAS